MRHYLAELSFAFRDVERGHPWRSFKKYGRRQNSNGTPSDLDTSHCRQGWKSRERKRKRSTFLRYSTGASARKGKNREKAQDLAIFLAIARRYRGKLIHQKEKIARKRKNYCDRAGLKIKRGQRNALWRARRAISKKSATKKMNSGALKKTAQAISRFSRDRAISSPAKDCIKDSHCQFILIMAPDSFLMFKIDRFPLLRPGLLVRKSLLIYYINRTQSK